MKTKYIIILLLLSVLGNAFFIGMFVGKERGPMPFMKGKGGPPPMEMMIVRKVEEQKEKLSAEGQQKVDVVLDKYRPMYQSQEESNVPQLFDEIQKIMTAEKFDKTKLDKLHRQIHESEMKVRETIGNMMSEIASTLSDKDRIAFFNEFMPGPPHKMDRPDHDDRGKHKP